MIILRVQMATSTGMARRILVVDDETLVCDTIRRVLSFDHHEVKTATGSQDALAAYEPGKFDLVITDYEMPGMKGDKLAAAIKALAPRQPIIMLTAHTESLHQAGDAPSSVDLVMGKPFRLQELRDAVRQFTAKE